MPEATALSITPAPVSAPPIMSRRHLMSAATVAAIASPALVLAIQPAQAARNPDRDLLAACDRFVFLDAEYARLCPLTDWVHHEIGQALTPAEQALEDEQEAASEELFRLGDRIARCRPQTPEGFQAKARAILTYGGHSEADMICRLTLSLVQDVAGGLAS